MKEKVLLLTLSFDALLRIFNYDRFFSFWGDQFENLLVVLWPCRAQSPFFVCFLCDLCVLGPIIFLIDLSVI